MLYIKPVWIGILFTYLLHRHLTLVNGGSNTKAAAPYYLSDVAIDCGTTVGNSTALDGREWVGEAASKFVSGKPRSSTAVDKSFLGVDPVPYMTSRISATPFHYTFPVNPGQKFIRLHFYPASYRGFEKSTDFFSVRAGPFTLLRDYSASLTADALGIKYLVKEFCLNVEENELLKITFSPSQSSSKSKTNTYAFVNGIEIISMPSGLYYTPDGDLGAPIVGQHNRFYSIDNSTALELIQRLNIGGSSISPIEDFGMFRRWNEDTSYLLEARAHRVIHPVLKIKYTNMPAFIAPAKIYQTSWKSRRRIGVKQMYNFTWKVSVDLRFRYLVRLHFCELGSGMAEREPREFSVFINNQIAEINADVFRWSGDIGIPVYRDYILITKGGREGSKSDLLIGLQSVSELVFGLLNGLEIFKLSNLENSLAAPSLVFPNRVSSSRNLKIENLFLAFGQGNVIGTAMTVLIALLSIGTYNLRKIWEENFHDEKDAQLASVEPSHRCFSLAEIKLATQNFSDAFVIGRGGFGKVYKGFIHSVSETVAIKRLSSYSRQGAREFWTEIEMLSKLRHIHLVSLIGYCNEFQEMILVYEYVPGGTLADNLYKFSRKGKDCAPLSWEQRLRICIGAARGLEYLHTGSEYGVIHRDIKDTNILLAKSSIAKISDFGLSKLEKKTLSKSYVSTKVKGTVGYLDPDYFMTNRLTRKSDVYAFGVVLLVVLSGRPALDTIIPGEPQSLLSCFRECIAEGEFDRIVDLSLKGKMSPNSFREFLKSIESCLHPQPKKRPTMAQLVASLEHSLQLQERLTISVSGDATVAGQAFEEGNIQPLQLSQGDQVATLLEESAISPLEEIAREKDYITVPKPVWGGPWKAIWSKALESFRIPSKTGNSSTPSSLMAPSYNGKSTSLDSITSPRSESETLSSYVKPFSFRELRDATRNFRNDCIIGEGSSGYVGWIDEQTLTPAKPGCGMRIDVKKMNPADSQRYKGDFLRVVNYLGQLHHPNIVKLIGYCSEDDQRLLVYEFMDEGSLEYHLFRRSEKPLSWETRIKVAIGAARGLSWLHDAAEKQVIHRDFKTSNILLDSEFNAKLSDFGLAKFGPSVDMTHVSTEVVGTYGYAAPEYIATGRLTTKSDVYSFGVVWVELLSGRRAVDHQRPAGMQNLVDWAKRYLGDKRKLFRIMDPRLDGHYRKKQAFTAAKLALQCLQNDPKLRPGMADVVAALEHLSNSKQL